MADRRRPVPSRDSECESEGNPNEDLSEYESAPEENKDGTHEVEGDEDSSETEEDTEEGETSEEETEDGDYADDDVVVEGEDGDVEEERQSGDGQEQPELISDDLDDDEDKKNPAYVPRKGAFYEHDLRIDETEEGQGEIEPKEERPKKKLWKDDAKWLHDRFSESQQAPKSREELVALYGYDIRSHDKPPDRPPKMDRRRQDNPRDRPNELGDYISDKPNRYNKSAPSRGSNYEERSQQHYNNDDDRPPYDNNRQQMNRGREESPRYDKRRQNNNSYQNRQNSYNDSRRGRSYNNLKDRGEDGYRGNRSEYQKSNNFDRNERQDTRTQQDPPARQDARFQESGDVRQRQNNGRKFEEKNRRNFRDQDPPNERRGPEQRPRGPDRENRGPNKDWERDQRSANRPTDQGFKGPDRNNQDTIRDNRGPDWGPQSRTQGGRGPRLQRGGHHTSGGVRTDNRDNRPNFADRANENFPRQFTNSAYKETPISDVQSEEQSKAKTIQINVVNKTALLDRKSYARERRGRAVGRTRMQEGQGYSMDQTLLQQEDSPQVKEEFNQVVPHRQPMPSQHSPGQDLAYQPNQTAAIPTGSQDMKSFPAAPVVKQEVGQTRPKRYSTQRQRTLPDAQYTETTVSPVENQAFFNQGFRAPAPIFRPEHPAQAGLRPRQKAPFPQPPLLRPPLHYPVPVSTAGLPTPRPLYAGGPPVSLPAGQPLIPPQYVPAGMIYGAPPGPYQMPAPVPVQNFSSPPPVPVQVQQPVQLSAQPSPSEVYRGGTTYYAPQLQPSNPNRSPVRRQKLAIPIVRPQESQGGELSHHYYLEDQPGVEYAEGEELLYMEGEQSLYQEAYQDGGDSDHQESYQETPTATDQTLQSSAVQSAVTSNTETTPSNEITTHLTVTSGKSNIEATPLVKIDNAVTQSAQPKMPAEVLTQNTDSFSDPEPRQTVIDSGFKHQPVPQANTTTHTTVPVEAVVQEVLVAEIKPEPRAPVESTDHDIAAAGDNNKDISQSESDQKIEVSPTLTAEFVQTPVDDTVKGERLQSSHIETGCSDTMEETADAS